MNTAGCHRKEAASFYGGGFFAVILFSSGDAGIPLC